MTLETGEENIYSIKIARPEGFFMFIFNYGNTFGNTYEETRYIETEYCGGGEGMRHGSWTRRFDNHSLLF